VNNQIDVRATMSQQCASHLNSWNEEAGAAPLDGQDGMQWISIACNCFSEPVGTRVLTDGSTSNCRSMSCSTMGERQL
jgi:hypothetical protein